MAIETVGTHPTGILPVGYATSLGFKVSECCTYGRREDGVDEFIGELFLYLQLAVCLLQLVVHHLQLLRELVLGSELFGQQHEVSGRVVDRDVGQVEPALVQILQTPVFFSEILGLHVPSKGEYIYMQLVDPERPS